MGNLVIPTGFAQATMQIKHALVVRPASVTWGVDISDYGGAFQDAANDQFHRFNNRLLTFFDASVLLGPVTLRIGADASVGPIAVSNIAPAAGNAASNQAPPNVAVLVQKHTDVGGRRHRGRMFFPWFYGEDAIDEAGALTPHSARSGALAGWVVDNRDGVGGSLVASPLVILHSSGQRRIVTYEDVAGPIPVPTPIVQCTMSLVAATQRRRLRP